MVRVVSRDEKIAAFYAMAVSWFYFQNTGFSLIKSQKRATYTQFAT